MHHIGNFDVHFVEAAAMFLIRIEMIHQNVQNAKAAKFVHASDHDDLDLWLCDVKGHVASVYDFRL